MAGAREPGKPDRREAGGRERPLGEGTRAVRAGVPPGAQGDPFLPGPTFAAPYHLVGDVDAAEYVYGRYGNPTWSAYESALGELEGGRAVVFSSGMAAVSALLLPRLRASDVLVAPSDSYRGTRTVCEELLEPQGVRVRLLPTAEQDTATFEGAKLVWLETPSNPGLDVCDIRALADAAHAAGALVAVDNTFATPLAQRPLDLGADFTVASASKMLSGHADLILGYVAARDPEHVAELRHWRTETGSVPGPFEVWLAHRSLATVALRLERQCETALALAEALSARDDVLEVRYPGLEGDPAHAVASRQMARFGPILGFTLESRERAERFLAACRLVIEATSFGGVHTSAERRGRWPGDAVPEGFIRFSAGCEDTGDVIADVLQALDASAP
ncbi:MAG: cystathionine gamma-lyase [Thermoleophilaceae bacterium]|nr:cystathionine gamma-lyase [Thermoleophilaceae bacterium]